MSSVDRTQPEESRTYPPTAGLGILHAMIAHVSTVQRRRPEMTSRCMIELGQSMSVMSAAIARGELSQNQLVDLNRRAVFLETQANA